jgi:hypothetical protein
MQCIDLAQQLEASPLVLSGNPMDDSLAERTADVWKKPKDKFLKELKRLSQTPGLGEQERQIIRSIESAWRNYDISFRKYIMAQNSDHRLPAQDLYKAIQTLLGTPDGAAGLRSLSTLAETRETQAIHQARTALVLMLMSAIVIGTIMSLILSRELNQLVKEIIHRLEFITNDGTKAYDNITVDSQIKKLEKLVQDLNQMLSGKQSEGEKEPTEDPQHEIRS